MTPRVEIVDFGLAARRAGLIAEYDAEDDSIRVSAWAVACVAARLGQSKARRFIACAVAHEHQHRMHPQAGEDAAHAAGLAASGVDPRLFEAVLRESLE